MNREDLFIKMALHSWEIHIKRTNSVFDSLTDEQLLREIAPGKNRVIYLLGHLTAIHDLMLPLLGLGSRQYPQLDDIFISNPDKAVKDLPPAKELRAYWTTTNEQLSQHFSKLPADEWFQKHTLISAEDFAKEPHRNKLNVLINRTNHLAYHLGQLVLVKG
jgi:hypothetical protein